MLKINQNKAIEIAKEKIRVWREKQFKENDIKLQNAIADDDLIAKQEAIDRRDYLRDLPEQCEGKTIEELKDILSSFEIRKG